MGRHEKTRKHRHRCKCKRCHDKCRDRCSESEEQCKKKFSNLGKETVTELSNVLSNQYTNAVLAGQRNIPPDPIISTGPKSVIVMTNVNIGIYKKNTMEQLYVDSTGNFWDVPDNVGDVYTVYDEFSKRFWVLAFESFPNFVIGEFQSNIFLAVSKNSDPQGKDDFYKYRYTTLYIADFPKMAVDKEAVYITSQDFSASAGFVGDTINAFDKVPLENGTSPYIILSDYSELFPGVNLGFPGLYSPVEFIFPLQPRKSKCGIEKVLLVRGVPNAFNNQNGDFTGDSINVIQIKNVLSNPDPVFKNVKVPPFTANIVATVPQPPPVILPNNTTIVEIDSEGGGLISGVVARNSIWTTHMVYSDDGVRRTVARWYEFDVKKFLEYDIAELIQSGNADTGGTTNQIWPSINVDCHGNMAIHFTQVGLEQYPAIACTGRSKHDPKGTVRMPVDLLKGGDLYYQQTFGSGRNRWGDYSGLCLDPCDHETFWLFNEYPVAVNPGTLYDSNLTVEGLGTFTMLPATYGPIFSVSGPGALADPNDQLPEMLACDPLATDLTGKMGICRRGVCAITTKTQNMQDAGSLVCLVVTNASPPVNPGGSGDFQIPTLMFASKEDGDNVIDFILNSLVPVPLSLLVTAEGPATFGSDWTTHIKAFKFNKCGKQLNAPQTKNFPPEVGSPESNSNNNLSKGNALISDNDSVSPYVVLPVPLSTNPQYKRKFMTEPVLPLE